MRKLAYALAAAALVTLALVAALLRGPGPSSAKASSHREAPLISEDPSADNTDLYAFRSPDKPDTLTIVSNFIPGEDPAAGPNYYTFSPTARYDIYVDRNGDGKPDVSYYFQFKRNIGPFFLGDTVQPYTVTRVEHGKSTVIAHGTTPADNIGPRTTPDYHALAMKAVTPLQGGGQVFAGQRDDPFFADVGDIFDLLAIRKGTGATGGGKDFLVRLRRPHDRAADPDLAARHVLARDRHLVGCRSPQSQREGQGRPWQVGAGLPPRQSADQRGGHPDPAQGSLERHEPVAGLAVRQVLQDADPGSRDQQAVQARRSGDRTVTTSCRCS